MGMMSEFKEFIAKGNAMDLAVGVIIGAAFGAIVSSLVYDIITPLILKPVMDTLGVAKLEEVAWNGVLYGKFLASVINFIVVAFCIFMMIKGLKKLEKKKSEAVIELQVEQTTCRIPPGVASAVCKWPVTFQHDVDRRTDRRAHARDGDRQRHR